MYQAPRVTFDTPGQELAVRGSDEDIYPYLSIHKHGRQTSGDSEPLCFGIQVIPESQQPHYIRRPEGLPFTRSGVQDFIDTGLPLVSGRWSIRWSGDYKQRCERVHDDGFRAVFVFRTLEFSVRPVEEGPGPKRILLSTEDVERCLRAAVRNSPGEEMSTVIGRGSVDVSEDKKNTRVTRVTFEWRVDRAEEAKVKREVKSWRVDQFGKSNPGAYEHKKNEYNFHLRVQDARQNNPSARDPAGTQPEPFPLPYNPASHRDQGSSGRKRPGSRSGTPGPSHKRRSVDSQSSAFSSSQSATSSVTSSPDLSRSSSSLASSSPMYQQQGFGNSPRFPGPAGMISGARPGTGYSTGSSHGESSIGSPGSTRSSDSQSTITSVSRGMSGLAITSPGGYGGQNAFSPQAEYRPRPVPMPTFRQGPPQGGSGYTSNTPGYGQGYQGMPPPPAPPQGYPPQGYPSQGYPPQGTSGGPYNTPYGQGMGANPQQGGGHSPYPFPGSPADSQGEWSDNSSRDDPRAVYYYRGGGSQSGSQGSYRGGGGSSRRG